MCGIWGVGFKSPGPRQEPGGGGVGVPPTVTAAPCRDWAREGALSRGRPRQGLGWAGDSGASPAQSREHMVEDILEKRKNRGEKHLTP